MPFNYLSIWHIVNCIIIKQYINIYSSSNFVFFTLRLRYISRSLAVAYRLQRSIPYSFYLAVKVMLWTWLTTVQMLVEKGFKIEICSRLLSVPLSTKLLFYLILNKCSKPQASWRGKEQLVKWRPIILWKENNNEVIILFVTIQKNWKENETYKNK